MNCNYMKETNQNPNYVVYCERDDKLVMRVDCKRCKPRGLDGFL